MEECFPSDVPLNESNRCCKHTGMDIALLKWVSWAVWMLAVCVTMLLRLDCVYEMEMFQVTDGKTEFIFKCICSMSGMS